MADNTLEILIKLGVIGKEDAAAVRDLLKETGEAGEEANQSMNGSMPENLASLGKYKKAVSDAGESVEHLGIKNHELREITAELNHILPLTGTAMKAAFNPEVGGIVLALSAIEKLVEHFHHLAEVSEAIEAHEIDFDKIVTGGEAIDAQNSALDSTAGKLDAAADSTLKLASASHTLAEKTEAANAALKQNAQFADEENRKQMESLLARVQAQLALGQITEAQAAQRERDIKGEFGASTNLAASQSESKEIQTLKDELEKQKALLEGFEKQKTATAGAVGSADTSVETAKGKLDRAQKDLSDQNEFFQKHHADFTPEQFETEMAKSKQLDLRVVQFQGAYDEAVQSAERVKKSVATIADNLQSAQSRIAELNLTIGQREVSHEAADTHRTNMEGFGRTQAEADQLSKLANTPGGKEESQAEQIAKMIANHQQVTSSQMQFIANAYVLATGHQAQTWQQIIALFKPMGQTQAALITEINSMNQRLTTLSQQLHGGSQNYR